MDEKKFDWTARGNCRFEGTPDMFPHDGDTEGVEAARETCAFCPVRAQCLSWALAVNEYNGVWGGFTGDERRTIKRNENRRAREARSLADA